MILIILSLSFYAIISWGILHAHGLALLLLSIQLIFYMKNKAVQKGLLTFVMSLFIMIVILQCAGIVDYYHEQVGIYYNLADAGLIVSYLGLSIATAYIHTATRETLLIRVRRLNRELQTQNLKLKKDLVYEINSRLKLENSISDIRNKRAIETEYSNALDKVELNTVKLEESKTAQLQSKSTIHTIANEFQRLIFDFYNINISENERQNVLKKIKNINGEFKTYKEAVKSTAGNLENSDEYSIAQQIEEIGHNIELATSIKVAKKEPFIMLPLSLMQSVIYSLLNNSKQAGADIAYITIKRVRKSTPEMIEIRFQDDGNGITTTQYDELKELLKDPTTVIQENHGAFGSGISTVNEIVTTQLGGTFNVKRAPSTGAFAATVKIPTKLRKV